MMNTLMISPLPSSFISHRPKFYYYLNSTTSISIRSATSDEHTPISFDVDVDVDEEVSKTSTSTLTSTTTSTSTSTSSAPLLKKVAQKTASTFAPRPSTASKNPAVPGSTLYTVFEVQAYASMLFGGALSFNLIFPSDQPDIWRLMGMWSIWMFTIPSLRARDCSKNEKEALNYLFLLIPLLNVTIPFFFKSFPLVWSTDIIAFFAMYAWKFGWLHRTD